ncbi:hypothetical protein AEQU1_01436 [Aequorivita sp. CIP111184]|nr:hypothetical protein AEQU1_01436 [Aequorivita sp. CIP111184]
MILLYWFKIYIHKKIVAETSLGKNLLTNVSEEFYHILLLLY